MSLLCFCLTRYPCPQHTRQAPHTATSARAPVSVPAFTPTHAGLTPPVSNTPPASQSAERLHPPTPPQPTKRPHLVSATSSKQPGGLAALHRATSMRVAAANLPLSYRVGTELEPTESSRAARAIDVWYFVIGAWSKEEPSQEDKDILQASDRTRSEQTTLDLRKPQEP
ncbi:hypothetical protein FRC08_007320 [Ceratobasidium sp. 394]|nr:hypothetical protein FRC08_007320 [Ceratobasidium sp. 394]